MATPQLTLRITRATAHPPAEGQVRDFDERGGTIGRAAGNDWILPDPSRVLSAHHATLYFEDGCFRLVDCSTNGVFVNDDAAPLGPARIAALRHGDRLQLGDYELSVAIAAERAPAALPAAGTTAAPAIDPLQLLGRADLAPVPAPAHPAASVASAWFAPGPAALPATASAVVDPLLLLGVPGDPRAHVPDADAARDDAPALAAFFQPPGAAVPVPADWLGSSVALRSAALPVAPPPMPAAPLPMAGSPPLPVAPRLPAPLPPATAAAASIAPDDELRAAIDILLRAAGLDPARVPRTEPRATLAAAGHLLRESVGALRELLLARARARHERGLPAAVVQAQGNNPLAFCPRGAGQAIEMLLFDEGPACLGATAALQATLAELLGAGDEEIAMARAAAATTLDALAPDAIEQACDAPARSRWRPGATPAPAACWSLFKIRHAEALAALGGVARAPRPATADASIQTGEAAHGLA
jgi:type VI secretion system FHA domain protein